MHATVLMNKGERLGRLGDPPQHAGDWEARSASVGQQATEIFAVHALPDEHIVAVDRCLNHWRARWRSA